MVSSVIAELFVDAVMMVSVQRVHLVNAASLACESTDMVVAGLDNLGHVIVKTQMAVSGDSVYK